MEAKTAKMLNEQINKEFYSAYLYLDMANYYAKEGLEGFQNWFEVQAKEEQDHAMLIRSFLIDNDVSVQLQAIDKPNIEFTSFDAPLKESLKHEKFVTKSIHEIYQTALKSGELRVMKFLDWFVKEQGEEEKTADDLIKKFALYGDDAKSLYLLNQEMGARVYAPLTVQE